MFVGLGTDHPEVFRGNERGEALAGFLKKRLVRGSQCKELFGTHGAAVRPEASAAAASKKNRVHPGS